MIINKRLFKRLIQEKKITLSTYFTLMRIALVPFIVGAMVIGYWGGAFWLFLIAAFTDVLDGNLARLLNEQTFLGACLDPIADKILLTSMFSTLAFVQTPLFTIPLWFVLCVLCKEIALVLGVVTFYGMYGSFEMKPTILGKLTTVVQICFIIWLFACYFFQWLPIKTYTLMLALVCMLTIISLFDYLRIYMRTIYSRSIF